MRVNSKKDYLKTGERVDGHLTYREDLYTELAVIAARWKEPMGKIADTLIMQLVNDKEFQEKIHNAVRNYR